MRTIYFLYFYVTFWRGRVQCFDVFWGSAAGIVSVIGTYSGYRTVVDYAKCFSNLYECCNDNWVVFNITGLKHDLKSHVFGQHIVERHVPAALSGQRFNPSKPLVMSFHGWPGGGKNYVSQFVARNMFKKGLDSQFYHYISGRIDYPLESKVMQYQDHLRKLVTESVTLCDRSLFVIDEVDKMAPGVLDGIKPFLDYHTNIRGVNYRNAVFIFLSNNGGTLITERYIELWQKLGKSRHEMTANDFDTILGKGAFNEKGGLRLSDLIDHSLIDHYIPFLPLEKKHVERCIMAEIEKHGPYDSQEIIEEVMETVVFGPNPERLFATSGCKRLSQKVAAILERKKLFREEL